MPCPAIDLRVESPLWARLPQADAIVRRAATAVGASASQAAPVGEGDEACVVLGDDAMIRELNGRWRQKNAPTNVLSFPASFRHKGDGAHFLGDIVLAFETIEREAKDDDKPLADHVAHLVVHGILHLLGHDHVKEAEAVRMEALEMRILVSLGIADPYAAHAV